MISWQHPKFVLVLDSQCHNNTLLRSPVAGSMVEWWPMCCPSGSTASLVSGYIHFLWVLLATDSMARALVQAHSWDARLFRWAVWVQIFPLTWRNVSWNSAEACDSSYPNFLRFLSPSQATNQHCDLKAFLPFAFSLSFFLSFSGIPPDTFLAHLILA